MKQQISNFERRNNPSINFDVTCPNVERKTLVVTSELDSVSNRIIKKVEYKKSDISERLNVYKVNDFSLENLIATGITLKPTQLTSSKFTALDTFENGDVSFENQD